MTSERRKAILFLSITLVVGILIGSLVPAFFGRMRRDGSKDHGRVERGGKRADRRAGFEKMIYRIVEADTMQKQKIQPMLNAAAVKIESLEKESNERMTVIMDSLKIQLHSVLTEAQAKKLDDFAEKNKSRRRGF